MSISQLKKCLKLCNKKYETEYSGNANLRNIKKISKTRKLWEPYCTVATWYLWRDIDEDVVQY